MKRPWMHTVLRAEAGAGGDDGSGGGAKPALTDEMKKEISTMLNGAIKGWGERLKGEVGSSLEEKLKPFAGIGDTLKALQEKIESSGDPKPPKGSPPPESDKEILKLRGQLDSIQQRLTATENEKKEIETRTQRAEEKTILEKALSDAGVKGGVLSAAVALLTHERKVIVRRDDGAIGYKVQRESAGQRYEDVLDVKEGIAEFLKTDEGKGFLPPKAVGGSGDPTRPSGFGGLVSPSSGDIKTARAIEVVSNMLNGGGQAFTGFGDDPRK